nr:bluetail domain-containing putative surface protein [Thiocystis violacea]
MNFVNERSTIDATSFTGKLNVTASQDNDIIIGGSAVDTIRGHLGADTVTGNGGNDVFVVAFGNATAGATPAIPEILNVTGLTAITNTTNPVAFSITYDADKAAGPGAPVTYTVDDTNGAFSIANDIADYAEAIQTSLQAQIDPSITVTAVDADTLRFTDANGGDLTAAEFIAPPTPATIDLNVVDAANVSSISFTLNGIPVAATGLTLTNTEAGLAAALQAAVRAADPTFAAFTVTEETLADNQLLLADPAGTNLAIAAFTVLDDITVPGVPAVASSTNIAFATANDFINTNEITINATPVDVSLVAGNGAGVAAALEAGLVGSTVTWDQATLTLNVQFAAGTAIDELTIAADNLVGPGGLASNIVATEIAAGSPLTGQVGGAPVLLASSTDNDDGVLAAPYVGVVNTEAQDGVLAIPGAGASSESNINALDTITDFTKGADKIDLLSFANAELPAPLKAWYAGDVTATAGANNLATAINLAISDVNGATQTGAVPLGANEAVLFQYSGDTYALVNDGTAAYSATDDVLIKITGSLALTEGALTVNDYFA